VKYLYPGGVEVKYLYWAACLGVGLILGSCASIGGDGAACSYAHADYIAQRKAMAECTVANNCVLTPEAFLKLERAEANAIASCPVEEQK